MILKRSKLLLACSNPATGLFFGSVYNWHLEIVQCQWMLERLQSIKNKMCMVKNVESFNILYDYSLIRFNWKSKHLKFVLWSVILQILNSSQQTPFALWTHWLKTSDIYSKMARKGQTSTRIILHFFFQTLKSDTDPNQNVIYEWSMDKRFIYFRWFKSKTWRFSSIENTQMFRTFVYRH